MSEPGSKDAMTPRGASAPRGEPSGEPSGELRGAPLPPAPAELSLRRRVLQFVALGAASVLFDQATKIVATEHLKGTPTRSYWGDLFRFTWATNDGAFLSLGSSLPPGLRFFLLTLGVGVLLLGLTVHAFRAQGQSSAHVTGYALIVSGGFSNWIDRARFDGSVVDFMNLGIGRLRTGIFNVADLAILAGIGALLLAGWRSERAAGSAAAAEGAAEDRDIAAAPEATADELRARSDKQH